MENQIENRTTSQTAKQARRAQPNRVRIIGILVLVAATAFLAWLFFSGVMEGPEAVQGEPAMVVLDFYEPWLAAVRSTSTDPYQEGLASSRMLGKDLRARLAEAQNRSEDEPDPVLCQSFTPRNLSARPVFENEDQSQVMVMPAEAGPRKQAIVNLTKLDGGWYIDDIECTSGETAPDREFSFEQQGQLLKDVPEPFDSQYWHIVFEQNNEQGHAVPLFFDSESTCQDVDGSTSTCNPDEFTEAAGASVKGEMTEEGVEVKQLKFIE